MELSDWGVRAVEHLQHELRRDHRWSKTLAPALEPSRKVHLAVFVEPFLAYVLEGKKSIESRFSTRQCAPFRRVSIGDIVLLKEASGPVRGVCEVAKTWFFDLDSMPLAEVRERFAVDICATDDDFWRARDKADYATLLKLRSVRKVTPLRCPKRDRRGWVVLSNTQKQLTLPIS